MADKKPYIDPFLGVNQGTPVGSGSMTDFLEREKQRVTKDLNTAKMSLGFALERRKRDGDSWVSQLGLDNDSVAGSLTNLGAYATSGTASVLSTIAAIPSYAQQVGAAVLPTEDFDAFNRQKQGKATAEDTARLKRSLLGTNITPEDVINNGVDSGKTVAKIKKALDISSIVNRENAAVVDGQMDENLAPHKKQIERGWTALKNYEEAAGWSDIVPGLAKYLASGAGTLASNPASTLELMAENAPQLVAGGLGKKGAALLGTRAFGYALDTMNKGIEDYKKANNGAMPSEEDRLIMATKAITAAAADYVTDVKLGGEVVGAFKKGTGKSGVDALLSAPKDIAKSAGMEGVTEGYQTWAEESIGGQGADYDKVLRGGLYGAAVGGGFQGTASALNGLKDVSLPKSEQGTSEDAPIGPSPEFEAAVAAKDPGSLMKTGKLTDKLEAIKAAGHLILNEDAPDEQKATWKATADEALASIEKYQTKVAELQDPSKKQEAIDSLAQMEAMKQATPESDVESIKMLDEMVQLQQKRVAEFEDVDAINQKIEAANALAEEAKRVYAEATTGKALPAQMDLKQAYQQANADLTSADESTKAQANEAIKSLVLSMASENGLSAADARALADNKSNGLSQEYRNYFMAFADAMEAVGRIKKMDKVNKEILYGDAKTKQKGLLQYQEEIARFLAAGNKQVAVKSLEGLRKFAAGQKAKADAFASALKQAHQTGKNFQVLKRNQSWEVEPLKMEAKALAEAGGFNIHRGSGRLVEGAQAEASALVKGAKALYVATTLDLNAKPVAAKAKPVKEKAKTDPVADLEKQRRKVERSNPRSLFSTLRNKLNDSDLSDIYGNEWRKRFTFLKGKTAKSLVDQVTDGSLDEFLPANLRFGTGLNQGLDQEQQAVEYIKDKLRNQDYLTEDTKLQLAQLQYSFDQLDQAISDEGLKNAIERELAEQERTDGAGSTERTSEAAPESSPGSIDGNAGTQTEPETGSTESEPTVEPEAQPEKTDGILDVLKGGASFLAGKIVQKLKGDATNQKNPLVAVKDFLSAWKSGDVSPQDFLKEDLDEKQIAALEHFKEFAQAVSKALPGILDSSPEGKYARKNPAEFFMTRENGKLDLPENVKTAMAAAMMTWLADAIRSPAFNDREAINQILGVKDKDSTVSAEAWRTLSDAGVRRGVVANQLGQKIVQMLNMSATSIAEKSMLPRIESTLGGIALGFLVRNGVVVEKKISGTAFSQLTGKQSETQYFIRPVYDNQSKDWGGQVKKIAEPLLGTRGVLEKLFSVAPALRAPSFTPVSFKQIKAKKSLMNVPKWLARQLDKEAKNAYYLDTDAFSILASMSEDTVVGLQGAFTGDQAMQHVSNRKGAQAKKDGLVREWRNLMEFVSNDLVASEKGTSSPFYFTPSVWKNQRVGLANNLVNPQTSKIQRGLLFQESWKTEVDPSDKDSFSAFQLRVLEKFGVKIEKDATEKVLSVWDEKVKQPEIEAAVSALASWLQTKEMTPEIESAIATGVATAGEGMGSFNALMALAQMKQANGAKFTTTLTAEIDGVANGPMLSMLLLGAAPSLQGLTNILNLGGFFEVGKGVKNYNIFRGMPNVQDLYETAGTALMQVLAKAPARNELNSLWYFLGDMTKGGKISSAGRKMMKTPITALIFGSSMQKATGNMVNDLVDGMYAAIEEAAKGNKKAADVVSNINAFLPDGMKWPADMTAQAMLEKSFKANELAAISETFEDILGQYVKEALHPLFGTLTDRRGHINKMGAVTFGLYDAVRSAWVAEYHQDLVKSGQAQASAVGAPVWDLTNEQLNAVDKALAGIRPLIHTVMSKASGDLNAGILLAKQEVMQSKRDLYHSSVKFAKSNFDASMGVYSQERVIAEPGTMVLPTQAHSFDSGVSHFAADTKSLNVHDARITGVNGALAVAQRMNQGVWEAALEYSPMAEMYDSFERSVSGLVKLMEADANKAQALAPVVKEFFVGIAKKNKIKAKNDLDAIHQVIAYLLSDAKMQAFEADTLRLGFLSQAQAIDQYAAEGGQFEISDAQRTEAKKMLDSLSNTVPAETLAQVDKLVELLKANAKAAKVDVAAVLQYEAQGLIGDLGMTDVQVQRILNALATAKDVPAHQQTAITAVMDLVNQGMLLSDAMTETLTGAETRSLVDYVKHRVDVGIQGRYGLLGKPKAAPVKALASFFEANPVTTGKAMVEHLNSYLKGLGENPVAQAYRQMLYMASRAMGDIKVVYVTPDTDPALVKAMPDVASKGWFDTAERTMYVLSPDHLESGLDSEVLIHELTHAALHSIVDAPQSATQKELVDSLNALMEQARNQYGSSAAGNVQFTQALNNIHEFIAYGLTNRKFQKEVLGQMKVENAGKINTLITGLQAFLTKLAGLLFNKNLDVASKEVDGFTAMVANVTALYQEVAQQQEQTQKNAINKQVLSMASPTSAILEFTTHQVFDALPSPGLSAGFQQKLDSVLTKVVNIVHGPFGAIKTQIESQIGNTPLEAWAHALYSGQRPFASKALNSAVVFTQKEAFVTEQVEATVRQFLDDKSTADSLIYRELNALYQQAKEALKGKIPSDTYAYVFLNQSSGYGHTKSDFLSKFVALGLANEDFNKALNFETYKPYLMARGLTFTQRMEAAWSGLVDWIGARWTGTRMGQRADEKLERLVSQMVEIESRYKLQVPGVNIFHEVMERFTQSGDKFFGEMKDKVAEAAESDFFAKNPFKVVRLGASITSISARGRVEGVMEVIGKIRNKHQDGADGTLAGLLSYVRGSGQWATGLLLGTKHIEQQRQSIVSDVSKIILDSFKDGGKALTKEAKAGITYAFLRTGAHALIGQFDTSGLQELLDSPNALRVAIDDYKQQLAQFPESVYYIKQATGLGFYLATNKVGMHGQNTNSLAIARLFGTGKAAPAHADQAAPIIERLASLTAIYELGRDEFGRKHLQEAANALRAENQRGEANGIEMILLSHKRFEQDARERLFSGGNEGLMVQGYLPEVSNPHTAFEVVRDPAQAKVLEEQGYEFVHEVKVDSVDPDRRPARMYILRGGGLGRRQSGVFSLTDIGAKGASKHNNYYNPNDFQGTQNMQSMTAIQQNVESEIRAQFKPDPAFDPRAAAKSNDFMLPLFNAQGQIVDYRYVMSARNRDTMLERDNRFEHLLGVTAATTFDKLTSAEQNEKALTALHEHYKKNFSHSSSDFIRIAHNSNDPRMREIWDMLPEFTKRDVRKVWGSNGLWVPKNMVDLMFGYRKYSMAEAFEKEHPSLIEHMFVQGVTRILFDYARLGKRMNRADAQRYAKRGAVMTRRAEGLWQEVVHEAKDFIVIKGIEVMKDNMISNAMMLMGKGVPMVQAVKDMFVAWRAAVDYDRDVHALRKLELLVETGYGSSSMDEVKAKIAELQDALARNPVTELVEAGLKPTIVEDVGMEDNPYSYKSQLTQWIEEKTKGVNPGVMKAGRFVYMTHDTWLYNFLSKTTQYSDFVARYALYKHQTERAKVRMSKEDALFDAAETFVIYDTPLPKKIQYLDDMGMLPFIKYFLSIQRVLGRMFKDKPLATLNMITMGNLLGNLPVPTDSSFVTRIGNNPFSAGALMLPNAMLEAATVQSSMALVK